MQTLLTLVRALHFASLISLAGALSFAVFVGEPALRGRASAIEAAAFRGRVIRLAWASLALGVISGALWLVFEAQSMSGRAIADVFAQRLFATVLTRTRFGHDWELRALLALLLIPCLAAAARTRSALSAPALLAALALGAAELATLAGAGHAAAGTGWPGDVQLVGDGAHLLASGAWLGGLLPLALLFAAARRDPAAACALAAPEATLRFSVLGIIAVGTLLATGILNGIFLVGNIPSLLGTDYGRLLMLKIALFLMMVALAAINRQLLTPLLAEPSGRSEALRQLRRNALLEAALGAAVLVVVGALGTMPPALHVQPQWPLPFKLSLDAVESLPEVRRAALLIGAGALLGLGVLGYGLYRPRRRMVPIVTGLLLFLALGWWPLQSIIVPAYPTTFYRSSVAPTVQSVARGARVYADNCAGCHGARGHGDGPLARNLEVAPADLTAEHIFEHADGDLFWWISQGIPAGGMPGFATSIDAPARWDVINFIHARAAGLQALALRPQVTAGPAPPAPDFAFARAGREDTLLEAAEKEPMLLVFYSLPFSRPRLEALAAAESGLGAAGLRLIALPIDGQAADGEAAGPLPDFVAASGADTASAYALFEGDGAIRHCEFLVDRAGFLRARWTPEATGGLPDADALATELGRLAALPLAPQEHAHAHAH